MTVDPPYVLGISASHNGAACLLRGDEIVAAIQEERLSRKKRDRVYGGKKSLCVEYCIESARIEYDDLEMVIICCQDASSNPLHDPAAHSRIAKIAQRGRVRTIPHHLGHAVGAYRQSGFDSACVLVVDGLGSPIGDLTPSERASLSAPIRDGNETISIYGASPNGLTPLVKHAVQGAWWLGDETVGMRTFGSLGGMYSAVAHQIFGNVMEAGKVMGLAPYGRPRIPVHEFLGVEDGHMTFSSSVVTRFQHVDRWPLRQEEYADLAASVQAALEHALLAIASRGRELSGARNLVFTGGVALNSVANERLLREVGFANAFFQPASEDSGCAIGAAYYGLATLSGRWSGVRMVRDATGREYPGDEIDRALSERPENCTVERTPNVPERTAALLAEGKIGGWFWGRSELGPRALGQRSILCDPRRPDAKAVLNARVKHRESFRPFAPSVLREDVTDWFETGGVDESAFMLRVLKVRPEKQDLIPAVVHVDGTARVQTVSREQNPAYYELISEFRKRTGVPVVVNTSFNDKNEPIVESPRDALRCFFNTDLDFCAFSDRIIHKVP